MTATVVWHPGCRLHDPGVGHPERPARIDAVLAALRSPELVSTVSWSEAGPATREALERVQPGRYLDMLERLAGDGGAALDSDTILGPESWASAVAAAGVAVKSVECALAGGT